MIKFVAFVCFTLLLYFMFNLCFWLTKSLGIFGEGIDLFAFASFFEIITSKDKTFRHLYGMFYRPHPDAAPCDFASASICARLIVGIVDFDSDSTFRTFVVTCGVSSFALLFRLTWAGAEPLSDASLAALTIKLTFTRLAKSSTNKSAAASADFTFSSGEAPNSSRTFDKDGIIGMKPNAVEVLLRSKYASIASLQLASE